MVDINEVKAFFTGDKYATKVTGVELLEVDENYAKCKLEITADHRNAGNQVMGGAIYTLADFTFAAATNGKTRGVGSITVTSSSSINYLSPAKGNTLFCESKCVKEGKRTCVYELIVTDELGTLVALVLANGAHVLV